MDEAKSNKLAEFTALAHLLSLRNGGAIESPSLDESEDAYDFYEGESDVSNATVRPELLSSFRNEGILRRFLDRLSEILAVEKGGRFVSAAVLRENEKEECVDIWVARNSALRTEDCNLLTTFERAMTSIAKGREDTESAAHGLWNAILLYSKPRAMTYRNDVLRLFQSNRRAINNALSKTHSAGSELCSVLQQIVNELTDRAPISSKGSEDERLDRLVRLAFQVRKLARSKEDLVTLLADPILAGRIHTGLCFLGRVRAAYETFTTVLSTVWQGYEVRISPVKIPQPMKLYGRRLSLSDTLGLLGLPLDDNTLKMYINRKKYTQGKAVKDFNKLQAQKGGIHAEIQLVFHLYKHDIHDHFPYIGSSKLNCFLCSQFLSVAGDLGSRGCHGRPWSAWFIPDTLGLRPDNEEMIWDIIKNIEESMRKQLLLPLTNGKNFKAESTIGLSEASGSLNRFHQLDSLKDPRVRIFLRNRDNEIRQQQLADIFLPQQAAEEKDEDHSSLAHDEEAGFHQSMTEEPTKDHFCSCGRMTSRRCGKCKRDFFCSKYCESKSGPLHAFQCNLGRPLTTADYLLLDIVTDQMPEDADVLSDFGFKNLMTPDRSNLLGLYQGLNYLGISAEELHEWQRSGCLVNRIQRTYLNIPEGSRGDYFPWFMENHHKIFGSQSEQRSSNEDTHQQYLDNVSIYLEPQDRGKPLEQFEPQSKRAALMFFAILAQKCHPHPSFAMYLDFGFCVCHNSYMEQSLAALYENLLFGTTLDDKLMSGKKIELNPPSSPPLCTFMEFWRAFDDSRLIDLMDDRGLKSKREKFPHLDSVLGRKAGEPLPHVWMLQIFLNDENATVAPDCILFQYGFIGCANSVDLTELKDFYREVLVHADALDLEKASREQRLLAFVRSYIDVSGKVTKILEKSFQLSLSSIS